MTHQHPNDETRLKITAPPFLGKWTGGNADTAPQADSTGKGRGGVRGRESQIQALDCTAPILPLRPGLPESRTHDYVRHGTTTLWAALEVATGN